MDSYCDGEYRRVKFYGKEATILSDDDKLFLWLNGLPRKGV